MNRSTSERLVLTRDVFDYSAMPSRQNQVIEGSFHVHQVLGHLWVVQTQLTVLVTCSRVRRIQDIAMAVQSGGRATAAGAKRCERRQSSAVVLSLPQCNAAVSGESWNSLRNSGEKLQRLDRLRFRAIREQLPESRDRQCARSSSG